jgi:DNA-binding NarL/FixJ family response regulator
MSLLEREDGVTDAQPDAASLSPRQREVVALLAAGLSSAEIAHRLTISVGTANNHIGQILRRLGMQNRAQVAAWAVREGLAGPGAEHRRMLRKHVFVVNGTAAFLNLLRDLLQGEDFNVTTTSYVPRTFDSIAALAPDLLILDLVIGEIAGWDLLERLHRAAATRGVPLILVSTEAHLVKRAQADAERYGTHSVILRPLAPDDVVNAVHKMIGPA